MSFDAAYWDERYRASDTVWGVAPNRWVEQELADLAPGTALDLACGEGRNSIWLDSLGWRVTGVDFSAVALAKAAAGEQRAGGAGRIAWLCADATSFEAADAVDLALLCYLQLSAAARTSVVIHAAEALAPGGTLLIIAHDSQNRCNGTGGPQDEQVLYTAAEVTQDLAGTDLVIEKAAEVLRPVEGAPRPAIDALLRARRP